MTFISHRRLRISHTVAPRSHLLWFVPISYKKFYFLVIHDSRQKESFCSYLHNNADLLDQIFSERIISKSGGSKQAKCMEGKMWQMLSASLVSKFWSFYKLLVNLSYPKLTDQNAKHGFVFHLTNSMAAPGWVVNLIGRALNRYHNGNLNFFKLSFRNYKGLRLYILFIYLNFLFKVKEKESNYNNNIRPRPKRPMSFIGKF